MLRRMLIGFGIVSLIAMAAPAVMAQEGHHDGENQFDTTVAPLVVPAAGDFLPSTGDEDDEGTGAEKSADKVGVNTYVDMTETMKAGVLTPFYRFSPKFAMKAHVPIIWDMTRNFGGDDLSASGLGDVTVDAEYTRPLATPGTLLRFSASVKLPTGDDEKTVKDDGGFEWAMPLGTGTTDYVLKGQYARATPKRGLLFGLLYRKNSPTETVISSTQTIKDTASNQIIASAFGRHRASRSWWVHMGATFMKLGNGERVSEYSDGTPAFDHGADRAGTLLDIFPGVSYALGKFNPFIGVRIPLKTSYDNDTRSTDRDTAIIFQFSYSPDRMN